MDLSEALGLKHWRNVVLWFLWVAALQSNNTLKRLFCFLCSSPPCWHCLLKGTRGIHIPLVLFLAIAVDGKGLHEICYSSTEIPVKLPSTTLCTWGQAFKSFSHCFCQAETFCTISSNSMVTGCSHSFQPAQVLHVVSSWGSFQMRC